MNKIFSKVAKYIQNINVTSLYLKLFFSHFVFNPVKIC